MYIYSCRENILHSHIIEIAALKYRYYSVYVNIGCKTYVLKEVQFAVELNKFEID